MKEKTRHLYVLLDDKGRGWDSITGAKITPDTFPSRKMADERIREIHIKYPDIELYVIPCTITFDLRHTL